MLFSLYLQPGSDDPQKKEPKKRGRPPKNKQKEPEPKPFSSSLSSDESSNHALFTSLAADTTKSSSMSGIPRLPLAMPGSVGAAGCAGASSSAAWGEDEDMDVDVTGSPHSAKSSFQPVVKAESLLNKPSVVGRG